MVKIMKHCGFYFQLISTMFPLIHSYSCASTTLPAIACLVVHGLHGNVN